MPLLSRTVYWQNGNAGWAIPSVYWFLGQSLHQLFYKETWQNKLFGVHFVCRLSFAWRRGLPWKFACVLYCPIKINAFCLTFFFFLFKQNMNACHLILRWALSTSVDDYVVLFSASEQTHSASAICVPERVSVTFGRMAKVPGHSCLESNLWPFDHKSSALPLSYPCSPNELVISWLHCTFFVWGA